MEKCYAAHFNSHSYAENITSSGNRGREFNLLMRRLAPMAVRHTEIFKQVVTDSLVLGLCILKMILLTYYHVLLKYYLYLYLSKHQFQLKVIQ